MEILGWDPWGDLFRSLLGAMASLLELILRQIIRLTELQLDSEWFVTIYSGIFWIAIVVWMLLVLSAMAALLRQRISGSEFIDTMTFRTFVMFIGLSVGPTLGFFVSKMMATLSINILLWGAGGSSDSLADAEAEAVRDIDVDAFLAGKVFGSFIAFCGIIALLGLIIAMLFISFLQYVMFAIIPLFAVFYASAKHRHIAKKGITLMLGLFLAIPLMCIMLAIVFQMFAGATPGTDPVTPGIDSFQDQRDGARDFWLLLTSSIGMFAAVFLPFMFIKMMLGLVAAAGSAIGGGASSGGGGVTGGGASSGGGPMSTAAASGKSGGAARSAVAAKATGGASLAVSGSGSKAAAASSSSTRSTAGASNAAASAARSNTRSGSSAALGNEAEKVQHRAQTGAYRNTQNATTMTAMAQADEGEAGDVDR